MNALTPLLAITEEPLGERIGPFIFWPILALLLAIIVWAMLRKSKPAGGGNRQRPDKPGKSGRNGASRNQVKTWTRPEDYAEHHRIAWSENPATFTPNELHWPLAVAAVFGICSGDPWDRLAFRNLENASSGLQEAWGIRSRAQLLSRLHWILREGHRIDFEFEIAQTENLSDAEAESFSQRAAADPNESAREQGWRVQQLRSNARGIREVNFEAWDLVRAAMLTRAGYSLGWLSETEAVDTLNLISTRLQQSYSSWQELGEHFMIARWFWEGVTGLEAEQSDAHDASRQSALLDPKRGPWAHVPWNQQIAPSRVLLADALVSEDLVDETALETDAYAATPLAAVIDEAIAARLTERP